MINYCQFCDQRCKKTYWDATFWICKSCAVEYHEDRYQEIVCIIFHRRINGKMYELHLNLQEDKTKLFYRPPYTWDSYGSTDEPYLLFEAPHILNIVPDNALDKIQTILMFL